MALAAAIIGGLFWYHKWPARHFRMVDEGILYRGGQPSALGLEYIVWKYHIKTVVQLSDRARTAGERADELAVCKKYGVRLLEVPILETDAAPGMKRFLEVASDPANYPIYAHCDGGANRTGFVVAAYRMAFEGWTYERAVAEGRELNLDPSAEPWYDKVLRDLAAGKDWRQLPDKKDLPEGGRQNAPLKGAASVGD